MPLSRSIVFILLATLIAGWPAHGAALPVVVVQAQHGEQTAKATLIDPDTLAVMGSTSLDAMPRPLRFDATGSVLYVSGANLRGLKPWILWSIDTQSISSTSSLPGAARSS